MVAELTDKFFQYFERLGRKKTEKTAWPSWFCPFSFAQLSSHQSDMYFSLYCAGKLKKYIEPRRNCYLARTLIP
jgi:hypothetical protein